MLNIGSKEHCSPPGAPSLPWLCPLWAMEPSSPQSPSCNHSPELGAAIPTPTLHHPLPGLMGLNWVWEGSQVILEGGKLSQGPALCGPEQGSTSFLQASLAIPALGE